MIVPLNLNAQSNFTDYLKTDEYLQDAITSRALHHAFQSSLIDTLLNVPHSLPEPQIAKSQTGDSVGLHLLLELLSQARIVERDRVTSSEVGAETRYWRLTDGFREALVYRDLLIAKLEFALIAATDYLENFSRWMQNEEEFFQHSHIMQLFDYGRCLDTDDASLESAWRWMRFTTALTRYESQACLAIHSMMPYRHVVDIGGNSGEFARQMCVANPALRATVLDLPAVCEVGRRYLRSQAGADRVQFQPGSALTSAWPENPDLITFKSMLHDWPDEGVEILLERAMEHLAPDGTLLIFERDRFDQRRSPARFCDLPMLMFFRSFRGPQSYRELLERHHLIVDVQPVQLEMPFFVLTARRS